MFAKIAWRFFSSGNMEWESELTATLQLNTARKLASNPLSGHYKALIVIFLFSFVTKFFEGHTGFVLDFYNKELLITFPQFLIFRKVGQP